MKKLSIIAIVFFAIISTVGLQSQSEQANDQKEAIEWDYLKGENYEIQYPTNWDVDTSKLMGSSFFLFSPVIDEKDLFRENINLLVQDLTGYDVNLDQYVELSEGQVKTMVTESKIISSERKEKDNQEYQHFIYSGKEEVYDLRFEQYYWLIDNKAYILTFTCDISKFEEYQKVSTRILESFKIDKN